MIQFRNLGIFIDFLSDSRSQDERLIRRGALTDTSSKQIQRIYN